MNRQIPLSKKNKREMSSFIGNSLLFDYIQDRLDQERKVAVENYLLYSRDAQLEKEKIENAISYCRNLQSIGVQPQLIQKIESQQNYIQVFLQKSKLKQLPAGIRWGIEAIGAMVFILLLLVFTPWQKIIQKTLQKQQDSIILAEIKVNKNSSDNLVGESNGDFVDDEMNSSKINTDIQHDTNQKLVGDNQANIQKMNKVNGVQDSATLSQNLKSQAIIEKDQNTKLESFKHEGFLLRGDLKITNVNASGSKITAKITELGGRKAGEVNLGWKKNSSSLYYHFTIPETKYKDLLAFLNSFGKINIIKEKHPRMMPEGIVRVILTVDEAQK